MKTKLLPSFRAAVRHLLGGLALVASLTAATNPATPPALPIETPQTISYRISPSDVLSISVIGHQGIRLAYK